MALASPITDISPVAGSRKNTGISRGRCSLRLPEWGLRRLAISARCRSLSGSLCDPTIVLRVLGPGRVKANTVSIVISGNLSVSLSVDISCRSAGGEMPKRSSENGLTSILCTDVGLSSLCTTCCAFIAANSVSVTSRMEETEGMLKRLYDPSGPLILTARVAVRTLLLCCAGFALLNRYRGPKSTNTSARNGKDPDVSFR
mmetsp:Transcript_46299/g.74461  ORF Transcript_46299/g.74461 Transcript_46299/m.74461 type:complete len:201 (-) Transcript_46299:539-1141(-)